MDGYAPFETERRLHLALAVRDLGAAAAFYERLLGAAPTKVRAGYAKFEPADPSVNLALNEVADASAPPLPQHFGIQVRSTEAVEETSARLAEAGVTLQKEEATACCYSVQTKVWATDPDGHRWEVFVVLDPDSPERKSITSECCSDEPTGCCDSAEGCCA